MKRNLFLMVLLLLMSSSLNAEKLIFVKSSDSVFGHPHDLSLGPDKKYLYVSDMNNNVIKILDPQSLTVLASIGEDELSVPHDVAFNAQGQMMVADSGNDRVLIYSLNNLQGKIIKEISFNMSSPEGVSSDEHGNIYVANAGNNLIQKFNHAGKHLMSIGGFGRELGKFERAHDLEYFSGRIYVGDPGNNRIQVLDASLTPLLSITTKSLPLNEPKYLALDTDNRLYIADQHNNALRVLDTENQETHRVTKAGKQLLDRLEGVEVLDNKVWVSDTYNDRIVLYEWQNSQ